MSIAKHILVVDDEALLRQLMTTLLAAAGYAVADAASGEEALGRLKKERFDLVVTDNQMKRMSGVELASAIKTRTPSLPVVMFSGNPPRKRMSCIDLILRKPRDLPHLLKSVRRILRRKVSAS
jgi:two-component system, chemotaxis family, chemotaxis protein CheY